jgi:hypothetical protein
MYNVYELVVPTTITIAADSRQQALEQYPNATEVNLVREGDRPWTEAIIRAKHLVGGKVVGYLAEFDASKDRMHGRILIEFYDEFYDESGKSPWFGKTFGDTVYVRKVGDNYHVTGDPTGEGGGWYVDGRRVVEDLAYANSVVWYDEGHYQSMEEYKQSKPIIVRLHVLAEPCGKAGSLQSNISDHRFATKEEADQFIQGGYKSEMYADDTLVGLATVDSLGQEKHIHSIKVVKYDQQETLMYEDAGQARSDFEKFRREPCERITLVVNGDVEAVGRLPLTLDMIREHDLDLNNVEAIQTDSGVVYPDPDDIEGLKLMVADVEPTTDDGSVAF